MSYVLKSIFLPPGINLILFIIGLSVLKRFHRTGITLLSISAVTLFLFSMPLISNALMRALEPDYGLDLAVIKRLRLELSSQSENAPNKAIVVLSDGRLSLAPEYDDIDIVNATTLQRLNYASWLQGKVNFPILLSGGRVNNEITPEAVLMNTAMLTSFTVAPRWIETDSKNTVEKAKNSSLILKGDNISEIILVTHAWNIERARLIFEHAGIKVISAPVAFTTRNMTSHQYLPDANALRLSNLALTELFKLAWYKITAPSKPESPIS